MIKRIKKVMALVLIATSVVAVAPRDMFKGNVTAYAATTKEGMPNIDQIIDGMLTQMVSAKIPSNETIAKTLGGVLVKQYESKGAKTADDLKFIKNVSIKLSDKKAREIMAQMMPKLADNNTMELIQKFAKAEVIKEGVNPSDPNFQVKVKEKVDEILNIIIDKGAVILQNYADSIPVYQYTLRNDKKEEVAMGVVVGGPIAYVLLPKTGPIYVDTTKLGTVGNTMLPELIDKLEEAIKNLGGNIGQIIGNISSTITGALDDVADSVDKISNSITDLFDDLDDSTDDFFDKINKDEGWDKHDGYVYYYDEDGIKYRGVHEIKGKNYYFNRIDGAMETGWQIVDGKRCYFSPKKGYQLYSQWIKDGDKIYCLDEKGEVRKSQWAQDGANSCYLKADGTVAKGWYSVNRDERYYFNETTGYIEKSKWIYDDQEWYYLKDSGVAATDWECINGKWYCFKSTGKMYSGWFRNEGSWYYSDSTGAMQTGWVSHKNKWFYLDESGKMKKNEWVSVNGNWYYFNLNGEMITSSRYIDGTKYHFNSDGSLQS
ncbi:N-acetylmuramoyl-L-alanine amidase family protein [Clostridium aquiflavi]|uniref:N-acetylmuramoyl-L-alanine amidase family protein n=1 Tax=Clostridium aquiflavi TaxID=3073603 RepID=A0ABU1EJ79_9CLOT|nr:N-acetylmuramoyl-L-alanine amidase family protein [Clostridium sp. 5N-1]MDR5588442.1 N-acetylmuramoyl-L-alanine amidase family protein [Clostridium sp. 5N-1]